MDGYKPYVIKSFKHNGHLHRMWLENWLIERDRLLPEHRDNGFYVLINDHTPIQEASGAEWVSRVPGVSFFLPKQWYNIVALIEQNGIRYYCNVASPPYDSGDTITYIDYDLDVILLPDGTKHIVDEDEYAIHCKKYHYSDAVHSKVKKGLDLLMKRIDRMEAPFCDEHILHYYQEWKNS